MENLLISACLLGEKCRYDGQGKYYPQIEALREKYEFVPICPEVMGGLPTPRNPSEIVNGRVLSSIGVDVSKEYGNGAICALKTAKEQGVDIALLKEKSPSCGSGLVHNGKFDGGLVKGDGITAALFKANGIKVFGESEIDKLL